MRIILGLAAAAVFFIAPAKADDACWVSYDDFERLVPHTDLMVCPGSQMSEDDGFCRLSVTGDIITIYEFAYSDAEICMTAARGYKATEFLRRFGTRYPLP